MDTHFGPPVNTDGEIHVAVSGKDSRPLFKQFNNVKIEEITEDTLVLNVQDNDISSHDQALVEAAKDNREEWFGRELADATLEKRYSSAIEGDLFSTNILKGKFRCYDHEKNIVDLDTLTPGMVCSVVVELRRIWFDKRNYGPDWYSVQVRLAKPLEKDHYEDYLFQDE